MTVMNIFLHIRLWTIIRVFGCWSFIGGAHHDVSKSAAGRDNLQKGGRVESRGNTIFCSVLTYFLSWWFSLEPRPRRGNVTSPPARPPDYCCVLASFFCSQHELPKGEMDQVTPMGVNTCAETHSKFSLWKCAVSYWSLLHDITHQSKWQ